MNFPFAQTIFEQAYLAAIHDATILLQKKHSQLKKIQNKDLDKVTDADCKRHELLKEEILTLGHVIKGFELFTESLKEYIRKQEDKIAMLENAKTFLSGEVVEYVQKAYGHEG